MSGDPLAGGLPTIAEAARAIAGGRLSPVALTEALLDRIDRIGPKVDAFIRVTRERALADAWRAEAEIRAVGPRGPLHGIPLGYKDIFETAGIPTTGHSRLCQDHVPEADAFAVARTRAAGAVCMGKLATHEFAFGGPSHDLPWPVARNPWNPDHFTGGSSTGTAAALAAGLILGGFGSDTGGSIRLPAAYSGVVGLKPTYGRVSRSGVIPLAWSLDHAGPLAWSAEDCAILLAAMAGHDPADPASARVTVPDWPGLLTRDLSGLRIGVIRHFWEEGGASDETVAAMEAALGVYERLGATLVEIRLSPLQDYIATCSILLMSEAATVHETDLRKTPELYGRILRTRLFLASLLSAADYIQAMRRRRELTEEFSAAFADVDVMFTAAAPGPAPRLDQMTTLYTFTALLLTMPFNVTGNPVLATRAGFSASGLPLSFQLVGKPFDEATVLAAGHAYERATDWIGMRPGLAGLPQAA